MMFKLVFLLTLLTIAAVKAQVHSLAQSCQFYPKKAMTDFNWPAYAGKWYVYARINSGPEFFGKCITYDYTNVTSTGGALTQRQVNIFTQLKSKTTGSFTIYNSTVGSYRVTMPDALGESLGVDVLYTDYTNVALTYGCDHSIIGNLHFVWLKLRQRINLTPGILDRAWEAYDKLGLNRTSMTITDHIFCPLFY